MDVINLKISKGGSASRAPDPRPLRGIGHAMTIEDTWGGDIATAAISHPRAFDAAGLSVLGHGLQLGVTCSIAEGGPKRVNGRMAAPSAPGLESRPGRTVLGKAVLSIG